MIIEGTNLSFLITILVYHISTRKSSAFTANHSLFLNANFVLFDELYTFAMNKSLLISEQAFALFYLALTNLVDSDKFFIAIFYFDFSVVVFFKSYCNFITNIQGVICSFEIS